MKKWEKVVLILSTIIVLIIGGGIYWWQSTAYHLIEDINSDVIITEKNDYILYKSKDTSHELGVIFYPGGKVSTDGYKQLATKITSLGYSTFVVKMPFNLAIFNPNGANHIIEDYPNMDFIIGGHSLGGVMASQYASENDIIKGLFLLASYPQNDDLKNRQIPVVSLVGSQDEIVNMEQFDNSKNNLPTDTKFITIDGGNHSQFGSYGFQSGDGKSTITIQQQLEETIDQINDLIMKVGY